jgi:hypothetical protein
MRATAQLGKGLSSAALPLLGGASILLGSCGGGGMGTDPMGAPAVMSNGSMGMSCSMDMNSMNCPAPGITMMAPAGPVDRSVALSAAVTGASADMVMEVTFLVDGVNVGAASRPPYNITWDSTTVSDGMHSLRAQVTDSMDRTVTSQPLSVRVDNNPAFTVALAPTQLFPAPSSGAAGTAALNAHLGNGMVDGKVMVSGVTATGVSINAGFAGDSGSALITLTANGGSGEWDIPAGAMLTADQVSALMRGGLYVIVASVAHPTGEVRGQILPATVMVTFSPLTGTQEVPPVSIAASGIAATTVDTTANTLTIHVHTAGVADAMAGEVDTGAMGMTGSMLATLERDSVDPGHWAAALVAINASDVANFEATDWYVNIATPTDPKGAIRGQIAAPAH